MLNQVVRRTRVAAAAFLLIALLPASLLAQKGALAPTNVAVVSNGTTAYVSWAPVASRGVLYRVLRAPNEVDRGIDLTDPIAGAAFEDAKVEPGVTYFYQIVAVLSDGTLAAAAPVGFTMGNALPAAPIVANAAIPMATLAAPVAVMQAAPQMAPIVAQQTIRQSVPLQIAPSGARTPLIGAAPRNPTVTGSPVNATVSWAAAADASGYTVERWSQVNPSCCRAASPMLPANATYWADSNYPVEGSYMFRVTAHYPNGTQGAVDVSWVRPMPQDPAVVHAVWTGLQTVKLSWQAVPGVAKYLVGGLGNTVTVTGTTLSVDKVPAGTHTWTVLSFYEPGGPITRGVQVSVTVPLYGWVDLHTHPMSNLAFGGKLFHGAPDVGSLMPAIQMPYDPQCRFDVRVVSREEALSDDAPTHGDTIQSKCGDTLRNFIVMSTEKGGFSQNGHAVGAPTFVNWPRWNDITHQKMWWEWLGRAHQGGLSVMVALSHNSRTLADALGQGGPISGVTDDKRSSDLQIAEIKDFVGRHPELMQVALSAADVYNIVQSNRIAVVLGVEIDNIGNFNQLPPVSPGMIENEIQRLYDQGVRYIFPIHLTDNVFGGTAIYTPDFNWANYRESMFPSPLLISPRVPGAGNFWTVACALPAAPPIPGDEISYKIHIDLASSVTDSLTTDIRQAKLGIPGFYKNLPNPPNCPLGHKNAKGLEPQGRVAIRAMMKRGMIIDIDHMSNNSAEQTLAIAEGIPGGGYPLVSGHTGIRELMVEHRDAENSRTRTQLQRIGCLQGMFGVGTSAVDAYDWARTYGQAYMEMTKPFTPTSPCPNRASWFGPGSVAFGTDANSLVASPRPTAGPDKLPGAPVRVGLYGLDGFPQSVAPKYYPNVGIGVGTYWDYNRDGVAHYGMYADFVKDVRYAPGTPQMNMTGKDLVDNHLMRSADYFWHMWQKIEAQKSRVP